MNQEPPEARGAPDCIVFDPALLTAVGVAARVHQALELCEPILGKPTYVRSIGGDQRFASRHANDTLYYIHGHPRAGECRYTFVDQPNGLRYGYLRPE